MPPFSPDANFSIPPINARTADGNPRLATPAYIAALRSIDTPVPDLASTLTLHTPEDDVNEANVSFLRTDVTSTARRIHQDRERERLRGIWERTRRHMELGEISDERLRRVLDSGGFSSHTTVTSWDSTTETEGTAAGQAMANPVTQRSQQRLVERATPDSGTGLGTRFESRPTRTSGEQQSSSSSTTAATLAQDLEVDRNRRERLQRVLARLNRIHDPAYGDRTPTHNSLYDWSPAGNADDDLELRDYILELRQQQPNTHPEVLRVLAQTRLDAERERRERAADLAGYNAAHAINTNTTTRTRDGSSSLRTTAVLQAVGRNPRLTSNDPRQRAESAERTSSGEDSSIPDLAQRMSSRSTYEPHSNGNIVYTATRQRARRSTQSGHDARSTTRHRQSSPSNTMFQQAVSYLASLRHVDSLADALLSAAETGFAINAFLKNDASGGREEDFILDVASLSPPAKTSLLAPGTVLRGAQRTQQWEYQYHPLRENGSSREALTAAAAAWQSAEAGNHSDDTDELSRAGRGAAPISASSLNSFPPPAYLYPNRDQPLRAREGTDGGRNIQDLLAALQPSDTRSIAAVNRRRVNDNRQRRINEWSVEVVIHSVDWDAMTMTAEMTAHGIPNPGAAPASAATTHNEDVLPSFENSGREYFADFLTSTTERNTTSEHQHSTASKPPPKRSITTYVEGELLDFRTTTFLTESFNTLPGADAEFWRKFEPFQGLSDEKLASSCVSRRWLEKMQNEYLLMRWKERCFVKALPSSVPASSATADGNAGSDNDDIENSGITISGFYYVCMRRSDGHVEGFYHGDSIRPPHLHLVLDRVAGSGGSAWEFA